MTWTGEVRLDKDKADIGTAVAIWDKGGSEEFTHSERINVSQAIPFKARAIAARDEFLTRRANEQTRAAQLTTLLNGP